MLTLTKAIIQMLYSVSSLQYAPFIVYFLYTPDFVNVCSQPLTNETLNIELWVYLLSY